MLKDRTKRILAAVGAAPSPDAEGPKPEPVLDAILAYRTAILAWCEGEQRRAHVAPYILVPGLEHPEERAVRLERQACDDANRALFDALVKDLGFNSDEEEDRADAEAAVVAISDFIASGELTVRDRETRQDVELPITSFSVLTIGPDCRS